MPLPLLTDLVYIFNADEFGVTVTRIRANFTSQTTFIGIFDNETVPVETGGFVPVHQEQPRVSCRTSDLTDLAEGDIFKIAGIEYVVKSWLHDGTGVTDVNLEKV